VRFHIRGEGKSEKGLQRLMEAIDALDKITPAPATSEGINVKELKSTVLR